MPRGVKQQAREAMAHFLNKDMVPPEMRPKGKGAGGTGIRVVVLKQNARTVTLQYTEPQGRKKNLLQVVADFPVDAVVLYNVEAVNVEAPEPPQGATKKKRAKKKAAPTKKKVARAGAINRSITKAIRANKGPISMGNLSGTTGQEAPLLRAALAELIEEGIVVKEGAGRGTTYGLKKAAKKKRAKKKVAKKKGAKKRVAKKRVAKKKASKKKVRRKKKKVVEEGKSAPAKKTRKKKRTKKKVRKFGSSRRRTDFRLDEED